MSIPTRTRTPPPRSTPPGEYRVRPSSPPHQLATQRLLDWLSGFGAVRLVGIEGTGVYGAGLARYLHSAGVVMVEIARPDRKARRWQGKSDPVDAEAAFAMLCGAAPLPASSGKTTRHRLNRGGDRRANSALWRVVMTRMAHDTRARAYVHRRTSEGLSKKEIIRCLSRYVARELYPILQLSSRGKDLEPAA